MKIIAPRKALGKKVRFEVFKRDQFTCQYCGATAPQAVLVVDHITPVAKGGGNEITNLITSCQACNSGKSDIRLSDDTAVRVAHKQAAALQERRQQIEMMAEWQRSVAMNNPELEQIQSLFGDIYRVNITEYGKREIRKTLKKYGFSVVYASAIIACDQYDDPDIAINKLAGLAKNIHIERTNPSLHWARKVAFWLSYTWGNSHDEWLFIQTVKSFFDWRQAADKDLAQKVVTRLRKHCSSYSDAVAFIEEGMENASR